MTLLTKLHDTALIERTLAGQSECFGVLMNRHVAAVRKRVMSIARNTADQDDIVQETFLKAWRHLSSFRSKASFRAWITRIATNEVVQQYRRDQRDAVAPAAADLDDCPSGDESPFEALVRAEGCQTIQTAIARLPYKYRLVLIIRDLDELTIQETARQLHVGAALVKTRLFRARQMLSTAILGRTGG
jgi:RNA polymerase sigma-70 factor, ECF subfamily